MEKETENDEWMDDLNIPSEHNLDSEHLDKLNSTSKYCLKIDTSPSKSGVSQNLSLKKDICKDDEIGRKAKSHHKKNLSQISNSKSMSFKQLIDPFHDNIGEYMDTTILRLAEKISEKKEIELQKASICIRTKQKKDLLEKYINEYHNKSNQTQSLNFKINKLKNENESFLGNFFELKHYVENKINESNESNEIMVNKLKELEDEKNMMEKELLINMEEIDQKRTELYKKNKEIELENYNICKEIDELSKIFRNRRQAENNRISLLKQKADMINNLIESENLYRAKNKLAQDVSKILKSPYSRMTKSTRNPNLKKSKTIGKCS